MKLRILTLPALAILAGLATAQDRRKPAPIIALPPCDYTEIALAGRALIGPTSLPAPTPTPPPLEPEYCAPSVCIAKADAQAKAAAAAKALLYAQNKEALDHQLLACGH